MGEAASSRPTAVIRRSSSSSASQRGRERTGVRRRLDPRSPSTNLPRVAEKRRSIKLALRLHYELQPVKHTLLQPFESAGRLGRPTQRASQHGEKGLWAGTPGGSTHRLPDYYKSNRGTRMPAVSLNTIVRHSASLPSSSSTISLAHYRSLTTQRTRDRDIKHAQVHHGRSGGAIPRSGAAPENHLFAATDTCPEHTGAGTTVRRHTFRATATNLLSLLSPLDVPVCRQSVNMAGLLT